MGAFGFYLFLLLMCVAGVGQVWKMFRTLARVRAVRKNEIAWQQWEAFMDESSDVALGAQASRKTAVEVACEMLEAGQFRAGDHTADLDNGWQLWIANKVHNRTLYTDSTRSDILVGPGTYEKPTEENLALDAAFRKGLRVRREIAFHKEAMRRFAVEASTLIH